jgi:hypothetical protein
VGPRALQEAVVKRILDQRRNEDTSEELKVDRIENKSGQFKEKCLKTLDTQNNWTIELLKFEALEVDYWTDIIVRPKQVIYWANFVT